MGMLLSEAVQRWAACLGGNSTRVCQFESGDGWVLLGLLFAAVLAVFVGGKLARALVTLRALAWTPTLARRLSKWVKSRAYSDEEFFRADGAEGHWVELRKKAIDRLAVSFQAQYAKSIAWGNEIRESFSDLRFTDANRVPFPFMRFMRERFNL
jgi:glutamate-1-semialdehyde 2,1-aminomutase